MPHPPSQSQTVSTGDQQHHGTKRLHDGDTLDPYLDNLALDPDTLFDLSGLFGDDTSISTPNYDSKDVPPRIPPPQEASRKREQHGLIVKNPTEADQYQATSQVPLQQLSITKTGDSVSLPDAACREHQVVPGWHPPMLKPDRPPLVPLQGQGLRVRGQEPTWFPSVMKIGENHGAFGEDEFTCYWLTVLQGCTSHAILQNALAQSTPPSQRALAQILRVLGSDFLVRKAEVKLALRLSGRSAQVELGLGLVVGCPYTLEDDLQKAIAEALNYATLWPLFVPYVNKDDRTVNAQNLIAVPALRRMIARLMTV